MSKRPILTPTVGMDATYHCGSDKYAYTIVQVSQNAHVIHLEHKFEKGWLEKLKRERPGFTPERKKAIRCQDGRYRFVGHRSYGLYIELGIAVDYQDRSY